MTALFNDFLFAHTTNGVVAADASGKVEAVNPAAAALLGLTPGETVGLAADRAFAAFPTLVGLFAGTESADVRLPAGGCALGRASTLDDGRRIVLLEDISLQRAIETHREALGQRIAHDLRNPVAALIGYVDLADTSGELTEEQRYFIDRARSTAMKFYAVIGDMVDLAWIEAEMPLRRMLIDPRAAILSVVETLEQRAQDKGMTISTALDGSLTPILGDPESIHTVLFKLLDNAILYSSHGQPITVRAWGEDGSVFCAVSDHGFGIAPDEVEFIFDRLFRSRDPRVTDIPGGGLGLTTARAIVRHAGGDLRVESTPGSGSTFTVRLPAAAV